MGVLQPERRGGLNKGRAVGPKTPLDEDQIHALRHVLKLKGLVRDAALFEVALSTMLRGGDVVRLRVSDVRDGLGSIREAMTVRAEKTDRPVTVPLTEAARKAVEALIRANGLRSSDYLFTSLRTPHGNHLTTVGYRLLIKQWCRWIHVDPDNFSSHSLRRTRSSIIYRETGNLRAVQLLLGHASIAMTQKYLGIEERDALELAGKYEV